MFKKNIERGKVETFPALPANVLNYIPCRSPAVTVIYYLIGKTEFSDVK